MIMTLDQFLQLERKLLDDFERAARGKLAAGQLREPISDDEWDEWLTVHGTDGETAWP